MLALVRSGKVERDQIEAAAVATVALARATGQDVADVAADFAAIGKEPVRAASELNEKYGLVTASVYQQARALRELGKEQEAVNLLQADFARNAAARGNAVNNNQGFFGRFWSLLTNDVAEAGQILSDLGKPTSQADQVTDLQRQIAALEAALSDAEGTGNAGAVARRAQQEKLTGLQAELAALQGVKAGAEANAQAQSALTKANQDSVAAQEKLNSLFDQQMTKGEQLARQLTELATLRAKALSAPDVDQAAINRQYDQVVRVVTAKLQPTANMDRLLDAVAMQESGGRQFDSQGRTITSDVGALGMYQVMPSSGADFARLAGVQWSEQRLRTDADYGRSLAKAYLEELMRRYDGDLVKVLSAYHSGAGNVDKAVAKGGTDWTQNLGPVGRQYAASVLGRFQTDPQGNYVGGPQINKEEIAQQRQILQMQDEARKATATLTAEQQGYNKTMAEFIGLKATEAWKAMTPAMQAAAEAQARAASNVDASRQAFEQNRAAMLNATAAREAYDAAVAGGVGVSREAAQAEADYQRLVSSAQWGVLTEETRQYITAQHQAAVERMNAAAAWNAAASLRQEADGLDEANKYYGQSALAIGVMKQKRLEDAAAAAKQRGATNDVVEALKAQAREQTRVNEARFKETTLKLSDQYDEQLRAAREQHQLADDELQMTGMTQLAREKVVAVRQVELKLAKELSRLDKMAADAAGDPTKLAEIATLRAKATTAAAEEASAAVARVTANDAQRMSDQVSQALTDGLMRGFEDGKGLAKNFRDSLKNIIGTMVLRPVISFIVQPIGNLISGVISGVLGGGGGSSSGLGISDLLGGANNAYGLSNLFSSSGLIGSLGTTYSNASLATSLGMSASEAYAASYGASVAGGASSITSGLGSAAGSGSWSSLFSGSGGAATGLGIVAMPLIVGALIEKYGKHNWERFTGAASSADTGTPTVDAGSTGYDILTGNLPDRSALISQLTGLGASEGDLTGLNDRQLYKLLTNANTEIGLGRETGPRLSWSTWIKDNADLPDFYKGQGYANPESMGWWSNDTFYGSYGGAAGYNSLGVDPTIVAAMRSIATGVANPINAISKALGGTGGYTATAGLASDADKGYWAGLNVRDAQGNALVDFGRREGAGIEGTTYKSQDEALRATFGAALDGVTKQVSNAGVEWAKTQAEATKKEIDALSGDNIGEQASALFQKAATEIAGTITAIDRLLKVFPDFSAATQDSVHAVSEAIGGMDALNSAYGSFVQNFYSSSEKQALASSDLQKQFSDLGLEMPRTREEFRQMVDAALNAETGSSDLAAALLKMGDSVSAVLPAVTEFGDSSKLTDTITAGLLGTYDGTDIGATMAQQTTDGIYAALAGGFAQQITDIIVSGTVNPAIQASVQVASTGAAVTSLVSEAAITDMVTKATAVANAISILFDDPAFQEAMQRIGTSVASITIPTLNLASSYHQASAATSSYTSAVDANAKAAEDAAARVQDAWQSIADSLLDTARSIRGELADAGDHSLAYWKSQLAIQTAMARAGDQDAAKGLEALANSLVKAAETEATSRFELQQIRATTAASLEQTAAYAQAYANGATVPTSSQAYTTAAALPAVQVPASSQVVVAESPQMLALMQELVDMLRDSSAANGTRLEEVNRTLTNFKRNGVPTRAWTPA